MRRQYLLVMRHGLRQDEVEPGWIFRAGRPWDPPLAEEGLYDVLAAANALQKYGIQKVVSSPFLRCLQTASSVCQSLRPGMPTVEIDNSLCEVLGPTYFAGTGGPANGETVEDWLWQGETPESAWARGLNSDTITATSSGTSFPEVPETLAKAHVRYTHAIEAAADRAGWQNLLIVTHGEGVGKSVTRLLPWVTVTMVEHCGFTVAWREEDEDGEYGLWELESDQPDPDKGVFWQERRALN